MRRQPPSSPLLPHPTLFQPRRHQLQQRHLLDRRRHHRPHGAGADGDRRLLHEPVGAGVVGLGDRHGTRLNYSHLRPPDAGLDLTLKPQLRRRHLDLGYRRPDTSRAPSTGCAPNGPPSFFSNAAPTPELSPPPPPDALPTSPAPTPATPPTRSPPTPPAPRCRRRR